MNEVSAFGVIHKSAATAAVNVVKPSFGTRFAGKTLGVMTAGANRASKVKKPTLKVGIAGTSAGVAGGAIGMNSYKKKNPF